METEWIRFEPDPETITGTGKYGYDEKDGKKPFPYAVAEFTDNSLSATSKQNPRNIVVYVIFSNVGNNYIVIRDNGDGMDTLGLKHWATFALSPQARGITSEFPVGKTPVGSLTSEISSFGVGSKQAAFYIANSIKMISKRKESPYVSELCLDKHELKDRAKNGKPVYVEQVTKRDVGHTGNLTPQQQKCPTLVELINSEKAYYDSFSTVILSDVKKKHLGDKSTPIKNKRKIVKDLASHLGHVYYYYLNPAATDKEILEIPGCRPSMYLVVYDETNTNLDAYYNATKSTKKFVFKHPTMFYNLREVDCLERQFVEAAKDHFKFQLSVDGKRHVDVILRYYPNHEEAVMKKIYKLQGGCESDDDDDTDPDIAYFECFWQGRLVPYTTVKVTSLNYLKPKQSSASQADQILANCVHRLSGQLFFDSQFSVAREKLRILEDIEHMFADKSRVMMPERYNETLLKQWLTSCEKHNQEFEFGKEKHGFYSELSVKNPSIKLKAGDHLKMISGKQQTQLWKVVYFEKPKTKSLGRIWCRREPVELFVKPIGRPLLLLVQKKAPNLIKLSDQEAAAELAAIKKKLPNVMEIKMDGKEIPESSTRKLVAGAGQIFVNLRLKDGENNVVKSVNGSLVVKGNIKTSYPEIRQIIKFPDRNVDFTWGTENKPTDDDSWNLKLAEELNIVGNYTITHHLLAFPEVKHQFFIRVQAGPPVLIQIDDSIQKYGFQFNTKSTVPFLCHLCDAFGNMIKDHNLLKKVAKALEMVSDKLNITFTATAVQDQIEIAKINIELKEQAAKSYLKSSETDNNNNNNKRKATAPPLIDLDEDIFDLDLPTSLFGVDISKKARTNDNQAVASNYVNLEDEMAEAVDPVEVSTKNVHLFDATLQLKKTDGPDFNIPSRKIQFQVLSGPPTTIRVIEPRTLKLTAENHSSLKEKLHLLVLDNNGLAATVDRANQTFFIEVSCPHIKKKQFQLTSPSLVVPSQDILFQGKLTGIVSTELCITLRSDNSNTICSVVIPLTLQPSDKAARLELIGEGFYLKQEPDSEENVPVYSATAISDSQLSFTLLVKNELGQYVRKQQMMVKGLHSNIFKPLKSDGKLGIFSTPSAAKLETFTISYKDAENAKLTCILNLNLLPKNPVKWMLEVPKKYSEGFVIPIGTTFPPITIMALDENNNTVPAETWQQQPLAKIEHDTETNFLNEEEVIQLMQGSFRYSGKVGPYRLIVYGGSLVEATVRFTLAPGEPDHLTLNCPTQEGSVGIDTGREVSLAIPRYTCISLIEVSLCDQQGNALDIKGKHKPRLKLLNSSRNLEVVHDNFKYQSNSVLIEDLAIAASPGNYQLQIADVANHLIKNATLNLAVSDRSDRVVEIILSFQSEALQRNDIICTAKWPIVKVQLKFEAPANNMIPPNPNSLMLNIDRAELPYILQPVPSQTEPHTYYFNINPQWQNKAIETSGKVKFEVVYTEQRNLRHALKPAERKMNQSIELSVLPGVPAKLEIEDLPEPIPEKFVSNSSQNRQLFESINIIVKDKNNNRIKYHNIEFLDLIIEREDRSGSEKDYPQLDMPTTKIPFSKTECNISQIYLKQGVGTLEGIYILNILPVCSYHISPIRVKFHFRQQLQLNRQPNQEHSKLAVQLENLMQNKRSLEFKLQQKVLGGKVIEIHPENLLRDIQDYMEHLNSKKKEMIHFGDANRVVAKVPDQRPVEHLPTHLKSQAVGWIAHLGTVQNATIVRVLSNHMGKAMRTFLVKTTEAKKILYQAGVSAMSLDTVVGNDNPSAVRQSDPGSPRLAADLILCQDEHRKVWRSLLRGTVVVPSNNDAMLYQQFMASQKKHAPMILSLEGGRFDSSGIADPNDRTPSELHQLRCYMGTTQVTQTAEYMRLENDITRLENDNWAMHLQQLRTTINSIVNLQKQLSLQCLEVPELQYRELLQIRQDYPTIQTQQQQNIPQQPQPQQQQYNNNNQQHSQPQTYPSNRTGYNNNNTSYHSHDYHRSGRSSERSDRDRSDRDRSDRDRSRDRSKRQRS